MSNFYRGLILVSKDVLARLGQRTLVGAGQEEVWPGTAATRPTPAGEQLRLISTSVDDDAVRDETGTITVAGTMDIALAKIVEITLAGDLQAITTDTYTGTIAGAPDLGDVAKVTLNGVAYGYHVKTGDAAADIAAGVKNAANLGSYDAHKFVLGGTADVGDSLRLTLGAVNYDRVVDGTIDTWDGTVAGGAPAAGDVISLVLDGVTYAYRFATGDTATLMAAGVKNAANLGSIDCWKIVLGGTVQANDEVQIVLGPNTYTQVTGVGTATDAAASIAIQAAADANYTVTAAMGSIFITAKVRGAAGAFTCSGSWPVDGNGGNSVTTTHVVTGTTLQTAWTISNVAAAVTATHVVHGTTSDTVTGSYSGGTGTFSMPTHTITGTTETKTAIAAAIAVLAAADTLYAVTSDGVNIRCVKKARGVAATCTCSWTVDGGVAATVASTQPVVGVDAQAAWSLSNAGADITIAHAADGATADTASSSYVQDVGTGTFAALTHSIYGANADIAGVRLTGAGVENFTLTVTGGYANLAALATAMAAAIDASGNYTASAVAEVITVTGAAGVNYTAADICTNNTHNPAGVALTATPVTTQAYGAADILSVHDNEQGETFSHTVTTAVLNDEVAALAALINASPNFSATAVADVITVVATVPGVAFEFVDQSNDSQTGDLVVTIDNNVIGNAAGPGVNSVRIDYLDGDGLKQFEIIDMDGLTQVLTVATDVTSILGVTAAEVGSGGGAAGTISVTDAADSKTFDKILAGGSQAPSAVYVVPERKKFYLGKVQASSDLAATIRCKSSWNPDTGEVVGNGSFVLCQFEIGSTPADYTPAAELGPIPAGARIWLTAEGAGNPTLQGVIEGYQAPV